MSVVLTLEKHPALYWKREHTRIHIYVIIKHKLHKGMDFYLFPWLLYP